MAHHSCIGWVQVSGAQLPCVSMACLLLMRLPWPEGLSVHSAARPWLLVAWMGLWPFIFYVLLPSWAGPYLIVGFSFSNPFFAPFAGLLALLSCYSVIPVVLLFDPCLLNLFWACCMLSLCLIPVAQYYHWASIHAILGFLGPFHCFQASSAHLIFLGILGPFHPFGHPRPILILYSHGPLLSLLGFPGLNYHILYSWSL